ncbi:hypothetical protein [uncultured Bacteroides sp.]|uniref:hypothetical protein n=1 Tax=uncultured Bacteroides sp. TaxID=162156 RepID=UPI002AA932A8|nr:hypothetical protein [uncultured Bacteroides sp.]
MERSKGLKMVGFRLMGLVLIVLVLFITMTLWNWLIPALFNGPVITFWQTIGLIILSKIFFSGLVPMGGSRRPRGRGFGFSREGKRPSREDWWKRFNETNRGEDNSSTVE